VKANRKFRSNDDAVSPVIAVILMVAITVVLAATVYVWVSGFGTQSSQPQKSVSLTSAGAIASSNKTYTVAAATSGMKWSDLKVTINGAQQTQYLTAGACANPPGSAGPNAFAACTGGNYVTSAATVIAAGDLLHVEATSGDTLRILDTQANAVILTLTVG
jgi:flagellin-like protein